MQKIYSFQWKTFIRSSGFVMPRRTFFDLKELFFRNKDNEPKVDKPQSTNLRDLENQILESNSFSLAETTTHFSDLSLMLSPLERRNNKAFGITCKNLRLHIKNTPNPPLSSIVDSLLLRKEESIHEIIKAKFLSGDFSRDPTTIISLLYYFSRQGTE